MIQTLPKLLFVAKKATAVMVACAILSFSISAFSQLPQNESPQGAEVIVPDGTEFDIVTIDEISSKTRPLRKEIN
jgi:hypothetical protein